MKLQESRQSVERHGVTKKIKCSMTVNAHAFRLLARQYSDPIKAILQEIGANCADAHARVNKSHVPWTLQLPNRLDPHVRWRDYGVSMSPEVVEEVYANYMKSDKRDTNDEAGYFGIGSKTPLAYTDSFNVTTYLDGKLRMYTICYDEQGIPEINQFGEYETDEPNGVEVSFSVKESDWEKFEIAARHVYSFHDVHPIINGSDTFAAKTYERVMEGEDWFFSDDGASYVIMGNIGYRLDKWKFEGVARDMLRNSIFFKVPMGEVHMTPSRESLEYNDETIKYLTKRLEEIHKEASDKICEDIDNAQSQWQATIILNKWNRKFWQLDIDTESSKWDFNGSVELSANTIYKYYKDGGRIKRSEFNGYRNAISSEYRYIIKDMDRGFDKRCRYFIEQDNKVVVLLEYCDKSELLSDLGAIEEDGVVFLTSELPEPPKNTSYQGGSRGPRKKTKEVRVFCPLGGSSTSNNIYESRYWDSEEIDPSCGEHVYVDMERYDCFSNGRCLDVKTIYRGMENAGIQPPKIIGLNSKTKRLSSKKTFVSLYNWIKGKLDEKLSDGSTTEEVKKYKAYSGFKHRNCFRKMSEHMEGLNKESGFYKLTKWLHDFDSLNNEEKCKNLLDIAQRVGYNMDMSPTGESIEATQDAAEETYPMIFDYMEECGWRFDSKRAAWVVRMVNAIDTSKGE